MELNLSELTDRVATAAAIDEQITKAKGSAAARKATAILTVTSTDEGKVLAEHITSTRTILESLVGELDQMVDTELAKAQDTSKLDGLKAQRATLVEEIDALRKVFSAFKVDISSVPEVGKAPRSSNGSGSGAKVFGSTFYHIGEDGAKSSFAKSNLSGMAWYGFKNCGAEALKAGLAAAGVTELTKPFGPVKVTVGEITRTIGMDVIAPEDAPGQLGTKSTAKVETSL